MRIVYVAYSDVPGRSAASVHVMRMSQALADDGHDVVLLASPSSDVALRGVSPHEYYGTRPNFRVLHTKHVAIRDIGRLGFALKCLREIRRFSPGLVYGRELLTCCLSVMIGYRTVYEVHHAIHRESALKRALIGAMVRSKALQHVVVISESLRRSLVEETGVPSHKVIVAHDASDVPAPGLLPASIQDSGGRCNVGYIGSLHAGKGLEVIEHVAPLARQAFFHIIGGSTQQVESWKARLAYDNVHFYGHVRPADVAAYISAMDVCLLPNQASVQSRGGSEISEFTSPLKMFEYMAAAKAVICSDLPVLREVLDDTTAVIVNPTDWTGWASVIDSLSIDDARREALGQAAYRRFAGSYSWRARSTHVIRSAVDPPS